MAELLVQLKEQSYPLKIQRGLLQQVGEEIAKVFQGRKIALLSDENVAGHYGDQVQRSLTDRGYLVKQIVLTPGEETKNIQTLPGVYEALLDFQCTRKDLLVVLGGGVMGDLGGFVASTYLRGIDFVQIPTSLLAQVDSSIGGKVAVDLPRGKNLIGSFYHPRLVLIDPDVLWTLSDRFFRDGLAEVIKYACIKDRGLFDLLAGLPTRDALMEQMEQIIYTCCDIKREIVEQDEKDHGERMLLNFGHTIGHALESYYRYQTYSHGEAVAIGMVEITKLAEQGGLSPTGTAEKIRTLLRRHGLPWEIREVAMGSLLPIMALDKKNSGDAITVILLKALGEAYLHKTTLDFFPQEGNHE